MKTLTFKNLTSGRLTQIKVFHWMSTKNGIYAKTIDGEWGYIPLSMKHDEILFSVK